MIAIKSARKSSLRLLPDEEDNLLSGVDFQTYYLGKKDIQIDSKDVDTIVEGIYSQYMYNEDLNNTTQLTITVDTNQLVFRDVVTHHIEFIIALTNVKSVYCANKKTKFPNAVIIVCCLPSQTTATVHVLHCLNPSQAREFYNTINRAFDYEGDSNNRDKSLGPGGDKAQTFSKANTDLEANALSGYKVNTAKATKYRESNTTETKRSRSGENENTGLLAAESLPAKHEDTPKPVTGPPQTQDETFVWPKSRARTVPPARGVEERGLLDNVDPDDVSDDEFTDLARNRSLSDNIKARFGR